MYDRDVILFIFIKDNPESLLKILFQRVFLKADTFGVVKLNIQIATSSAQKYYKGGRVSIRLLIGQLWIGT